MTTGNSEVDLMQEHWERQRVIQRTSGISILINVMLAAFKAAVGIFAHSIAIVLDAVNNLSDALSSVIIIVGTRLADKRPDKKHPLGHGRAEYLSGLLVSGIVLYAGLTSFWESCRKVMHPVEPRYSMWTLLVIATAIVVKLLLGNYVKRTGEKVGSTALAASGADALYDALLSLSVLLTAVLYMAKGVSLEAYVGVLISLMIIRAGLKMLGNTVSEILGRRADEDVSREIKKLLEDEPEVIGAYDLLLNNYGPGKNYASVHIELPDTMTVAEVDSLTHRLESKVYRATGVILTGIGVYSYNTRDDEAARIRNKVQRKVLSNDWALQIHGFYVDTEKKLLHFDVVLSFDVDPQEALDKLYRITRKACPEYDIQITPDLDLSD